MKISDLIESAIWVTGDESPEIRTRYERDVTEAIDYMCSENGFVHGPVRFTEKHPMDEDVPEVPDHISGDRVRLLVAEADVIKKAVETSVGSFVANLDKKDLMKLRTIIRRYGQKSDVECDSIIENIGPEAAINTLRTLH